MGQESNGDAITFLKYTSSWSYCLVLDRGFSEPVEIFLTFMNACINNYVEGRYFDVEYSYCY